MQGGEGIAEHPERPVWYYRRVGRQYGPVSLTTLRGLAENGRLDKRLDFIRHSSSKRWIPSAELDGIHAEAARDRGMDEGEILAEAWKKQPPIRVVEVCRASSAQWSGWVALGVLLTLLAFGSGFIVMMDARSLYWVFMALLLGGIGCFLVAHAYLTRWVFHGWRVTNQYGTKIPAWLAAGLLWVPGVHLVWNFVALWVWARDFNVILSSHPQYRYIRRPREGWILAYCIYPLASPLVNVLLTLVLGWLAMRVPGLAFSIYLVASLVSAAVYLFLWGRVAEDVAMGVDGVYDLNARQ